MGVMTTTTADGRAELAEVQARNARLAMQVPVGLFEADAEGRCLSVNAAWSDLTGLPVEAALGHGWAQALHPDDLDRVFVAFHHTASTGAPFDLAYRFQHEQHGPRWVRGIAARHEGPDGQPRVYGSVTDLTSLQAAESMAKSQELRFRAIFDSVYQFIGLLEPDGTLLEANRAALDFGGFTIDQVRGAKFWDAPWWSLSEASKARVTAAIKTAATGEFVRYNAEVVGGDGQIITIDFSITPIRDAKGDVVLLVPEGRDITEFNQLLVERTRSEAIIRTVFSRGGVGMAMVGLDGKPVIVNDELNRMLGYDDDAMLQVPDFREFTHPQDRDLDWDLFQGIVDGQRDRYEIDKRYIRTDGSEMWGRLTVSAVRDDAGTLLNVVGIVQDITDKKRAEEVMANLTHQLEQRVQERTQELEIANAELARAAQMKDRFMASMSHELRTPLSGILNLSEALQEDLYGPLDTRQKKVMQTIEKSGRHLLELINDILELSKIEAGEASLALAPCSAAEITEAAMLFVRSAAERKRQSIGFSLQPHGLEFEADPRRLKQILVNLLSNAVKFTPEGGRLGLEVVGDRDTGTVRFEVWDEGIGIAERDLGQLFKPFVQLDDALARRFDGTGLGLSLVKRMVEMHGGTVGVESRQGEGSRFMVSLPWTPSKRQLRISGMPRSALMVEDDPRDASNMNDLLKKLGVQATIHEEAAGATSLAASLQPEVVLLDLQLPDASGWGVLERLKSDPATRRIPVVIASVEDARELAIARGADGFLQKPFDADDLARGLSTVVEDEGWRRRSLVVRTGAPLGPKVVLADDNDVNVEAYSHYLRRKGFRVTVARDGRDALTLTETVRPDVVVMDVQMPHVDGLEATRRLRGRGIDVPILALTALAMPGDKERCLEAGADRYLAKPVSLRQLDATLRELLGEDTTATEAAHV